MKRILLAVFAIGMLFGACAKPPSEEMTRAVEALSRAENDAGAVQYGRDDLARARDAAANMREAADSKRYDSASVYAQDVVTFAEKAIREGSTGAVRQREEAANLLSSLEPPLAETEAGFNAAKEVQNIQLDSDGLEELLESAKKTYDSAQESFSASDFQDTLEKGQIVRSILGTINTQISGATLAASKKQ